MLKKVIISVLFICISNAVLAQNKLTTNDLSNLKSLMQGSFSSSRQAQLDSSYFDIRLEMKPIWSSRTDGFWLYVEQAMASQLQKPYRQRVYHVYLDSDSSNIVSRVFELQSPLRFAGVWKDDQPLTNLTTDSLVQRAGCDIFLAKNALDEFVGLTAQQACKSTLRGASYATSEVVINTNGMVSWDRGFDQSGKQVWGAVKGGYAFVKQLR